MSVLISLDDAADRLGVSTRTVRRYIDRGQLQAFRLGPRLIRLRPQDVDALVTPVSSVAQTTPPPAHARRNWITGVDTLPTGPLAEDAVIRSEAAVMTDWWDKRPTPGKRAIVCPVCGKATTTTLAGLVRRHLREDDPRRRCQSGGLPA